MRFTIALTCALTAAPSFAADSLWPNKPGKKPEARLVVGVQSGAQTDAPADVVIGAGGASGATTKSTAGDYGFVAPAPSAPKAPRRSVGYDPKARLGNKGPSS